MASTVEMLQENWKERVRGDCGGIHIIVIPTPINISFSLTDPIVVQGPGCV